MCSNSEDALCIHVPTLWIQCKSNNNRSLEITDHPYQSINDDYITYNGIHVDYAAWRTFNKGWQKKHR